VHPGWASNGYRTWLLRVRVGASLHQPQPHGTWPASAFRSRNLAARQRPIRTCALIDRRFERDASLGSVLSGISSADTQDILLAASASAHTEQHALLHLVGRLAWPLVIPRRPAPLEVIIARWVILIPGRSGSTAGRRLEECRYARSERRVSFTSASAVVAQRSGRCVAISC
jgi:hypothetical protein